MFSRWGAFVYRFRKPVALVAIAVALLASSVAGKAASVLSAGGVRLSASFNQSNSIVPA